MKKARIAVPLVLIFGVFATTFSLAPAVAQDTPPSDSASTRSAGNTAGNTTSNATSTANATSGEMGGNATGGNQTGGFLGKITEGIQSLSGGGNSSRQ